MAIKRLSESRNFHEEDKVLRRLHLERLAILKRIRFFRRNPKNDDKLSSLSDEDILGYVIVKNKFY
ncbi:MAG: hypothetical protein M2R45_03161 [Verrucomicrobia subdivision 3 bacterium]|nr:hypothetical protein [Limisphaerales bacterium]MCS1413228.1 hypothetical protein [Limisphaerales bacterium]